MIRTSLHWTFAIQRHPFSNRWLDGKTSKWPTGRVQRRCHSSSLVATSALSPCFRQFHQPWIARLWKWANKRMSSGRWRGNAWSAIEKSSWMLCRSVMTFSIRTLAKCLKSGRSRELLSISKRRKLCNNSHRFSRALPHPWSLRRMNMSRRCTNGVSSASSAS